MTDAGSRRPPLDVDRLVAGSPWPVEVLDQAGSTNALLAERARAGADPQALVAEHQTAGRGRLDRTWETPPRAALTFSVLLRPAVEADRWPWLPLLVGYAVRETLPASAEASLKWPNDVLIGDRKVAGILVERVESRSGPAAVVGIGLNVSTTPAELPVPTATSLAIELGAEPDRTDLLLGLLNELDRRYRTLARGAERGRVPEGVVRPPLLDSGAQGPRGPAGRWSARRDGHGPRRLRAAGRRRCDRGGGGRRR